MIEKIFHIQNGFLFKIYFTKIRVERITCLILECILQCPVTLILGTDTFSPVQRKISAKKHMSWPQ